MANINEMMHKNKGLVYRELHRFNLAYDREALSYAYEGLYKAIENYDPKRDVKLSTYATVAIRNNIKNLLSLRSNALAIDTQTLSLDFTYSDDEDAVTMGEVVASKHRTPDSIMTDCILEMVHDLIQKRSGTAKDILMLWYDTNFEMTNVAIADCIGCSQAYVSTQIAYIRKDIKESL